MPYPIQYLLEGRSAPVTVRPTDRVVDAVAVMMEKAYGQLPVVDAHDCPLGMITHESIIQAVSNFTVSVDALLVSHAMVKADIFAVDNDLFDILDRLEDKYAVLIVNQEKRLLGIVTTYDSTAYFRRRAEDLMLIEDIESMIKDMIQSAFQLAPAQDNGSLLEQTIQGMNGSYTKARNDCQNALKAYLGRIGHQDLSALLDEAAFEISFKKLLPQNQAKQFDRLSLDEFISLLLHDASWQQYESKMQLDRNAVRQLLSSVRESRNQLAHFRGELSAAQRAQLRFCSNWLQQHQTVMPAKQLQETITAQVASSEQSVSTLQQFDAITLDEVATYETADETESRYTPLAVHLQTQAVNIDTLKLSFAEIEQLIGGDLPPSARVHRSWWANDSHGHLQAQSWLEAGWRVSSVNISAQVATFIRVEERQKLYIDFFSALLNDLRQLPNFPIKEAVSPLGVSWFKITRLSSSGTNQVALLVFAFARKSQFRVELYMHSGDQDDKRLFDALYAQKEAIETQVGEALSWQRLDAKQASRIALYHPGRITDSPKKLAALREWAIDAIVRLADAVLAKAETAMDEITA